MVAVGAHVEVERGCSGLVARVRNQRVDVDVLDVVLILLCALFGRLAGHLGGAHHAVGDEDGREELVLGTDPLEFFLDLLLVVTALAGVLHVTTIAGKLVVDAAVALLELLAELVTRDLLVPVEVHEVDVQGDDA